VRQHNSLRITSGARSVANGGHCLGVHHWVFQRTTFAYFPHFFDALHSVPFLFQSSQVAIVDAFLLLKKDNIFDLRPLFIFDHLFHHGNSGEDGVDLGLL